MTETSEPALRHDCFACESGQLARDSPEHRSCFFCGSVVLDAGCKQRIYNEDYIEKYRKMEDTPEGTAINQFRLSLVAGFRDPGRMLDYGAASGSFVRYCKSHGHNADGYDIASGTEFRKKPRGKYDTLTAWDVIEHIPARDPVKVVAGLVAPGGVLAIATPDLNGMPEDPSVSHHWKPGEHLVFYSATGLRMAMERNGFRIITTTWAESWIRRRDGVFNPRNILTVIGLKGEK